MKRAMASAYKPLGEDCDRADWERVRAMWCRKCGGEMKPGIATEQTTYTGKEGSCYPAGPGRVIACSKCEQCGWSTTT